MNYLIDTNICIYLMNEHPAEVLREFEAKDPGEIAVSTITVSELEYGVSKSEHQEKNARRVSEFLRPFDILPYDHKASACYGSIRYQLEQSGEVIGPLDMLIAAQGVSRDLVMVTNNDEEFRRVDALKVENWAE